MIFELLNNHHLSVNLQITFCFLGNTGKALMKNFRNSKGRRAGKVQRVRGFWLVLNHQTNIALSTQY